MQQVLINGQWRDASSSSSFQADNPACCEALPDEYPVSDWDDCDAALSAAVSAATILASFPPSRIADFLDKYAENIEQHAESIVNLAHLETALAVSPRLADIELPRTTGQLRQAAAAAREGSWAMATIDTASGIRSMFGPIGPVAVFGPNNFPLAFGSISGGDFAAAMAAGPPVIAKANSSHPGTTRLLAEQAQLAAEQTGMPPGTVQLIYRTSHADGERLVADPRNGATAYTGSRSAGLTLKAAADAAGKPIYLELSSVNPMILLPGALEERSEDIAEELAGSCLMGTGQFCTNPGLVVTVAGEKTSQFIDDLVARFSQAPVGTLLSAGVQKSLGQSLATLLEAGGVLLVGNSEGGGEGYSFANTLVEITADQFIANPETMQTEAFGNASLLVVADDIDQVCQLVDQLEGNLTGCIYSHTQGQDDPDYDRVAPRLRGRVGRLLNDKMPTGVAVSPAMNHGGPYPATGHPGFTAVGIPASLVRFAMLQSYDNIRPHRLPPALQDENPGQACWRNIDGQWTQADIS